MHDPMTVAFELGRLVTIWHIDPETDGSDDSCGWSYPKIAAGTEWVKRLQKDLEFLDGSQDDSIDFQRAREGAQMWWLLWLNRAAFWHRRRGLSPRRVAQILYSDSFPGNREDYGTRESPERLAWVFARSYLHHIRPWYRHPRWHFWHWRIQIHLVQNLKRWVWSRCMVCGGRFRWDEAPVGIRWEGVGPRWFRGEPDVRHSRCCTAQAERPA